VIMNNSVLQWEQVTFLASFMTTTVVLPTAVTLILERLMR